MLRVARFLRGFLREPGSPLVEQEVTVPTGGEPIAATRIAPANGGPRPGWVVLHGITVPGRRHPTLLRFARALAASGGVVLVPEIESWTRLRIDPDAADRTIAAAARHLADDPGVTAGGVAVVGFSFGATQALITAAHPELRRDIRSVVGFGGYCDLGRTLRFMMVGEHEWNGVRFSADPDPYGRWIVAANYLTRAPGYEGTGAVARAAQALAAEAGRRFVYAGDPVYDALKAELRDELEPADREIWDLLAPPAGVTPPLEPSMELADALVTAALATHPALDPRPDLATLDRKVVLAHGHADLLIPFSETLRLRQHLPAGADASAVVTRLFAHSSSAEPLRLHEYPVEGYRYYRLLARALRG